MGNLSHLEKEKLQKKIQSALEAEILTSGQVAALFGVNFKTVIRWARAGRLPSTRLPGRRGDFRFAKNDVLEFAKQNNLRLMISEKSEKSLALVVDDDPLIASSITRILHGICHVASATDGYQAGVQMALRRPTLVFLDLQMPGVDGLALLRYMRETAELSEIPVCLISGADAIRIKEALDAGANCALQKPFSVEQIRAAAAQLIHHNSYSRSAA